MKIWWLIALAVSGAMAPPPSPPPALSALVAKARLDGPVAAWCGGRFRPGRAGAFAVALSAASGGGRYIVIEPDASVETLAPFSGGADLSCYTRAQALALNRSIERSDTIHGRIAPRWNTTVVCGFVADTAAACWQYDPRSSVFVKVGEWVT